MTFRPNMAEVYFAPTGRPTLAGQRLLQDMADRLDAIEAKLFAIAEIADPTGGATTDAEARAAILAIIGAANG